MKAIINNKSYDTETAKEVANYSNGLSTRDFKHVDESLFVTKKGNWFTAGGGGPMSKYAVPAGDMTSGSDKIFALSPGEAYEWLELHDETSAIEEYFKDSFEDA